VRGKNKMLYEIEYNIMKKFSKGNYIESEIEREIIDSFRNIGIMRIGFDNRRGKIEERASLTNLGLERFKYERMMRNPIRKFLYTINNSIY